ncbi:transmembrane protein 106A [Suncus etruscus]|uniref:transmembrane protein 106A n=1 Tax=Suncus etruscus TaxID=109475 RepID=UPI002110CC1F|nr:transmembrane protein 106A [Suncus etruscus]
MSSLQNLLEDENKFILTPDDSKSVSYFSTCGRKSSCSCVPHPRGTSFVTCPTCQGSGEIPRELEKQLVALIPYGDQRLKPRRTKLFVSLAVLISLVTTSFLFFVLYPRSISVQPAGLNSSLVALDKDEIYINVSNILNISNTNYYPITVTQITIEALHVSLVVGQVSLSSLLHIGPFTTQQMVYTVSTKIKEESTYKICSWEKIKIHHVVLHIQAILTYSYLGHSEQKPFENYEYVDCRGNTSLTSRPASLLT